MFELPPHLHPMIVHFPIALFIIALVFEVIGVIVKNEGLQKAAVYMFITAALITPIVVRTGIWEVQKLALNHPVLTEHREYGIKLMWTALMSLPLLWFINKEFKKYYKIVFIVILLAASALVIETGEEGGKMVFEYGIGVEE